MPFRVLIAPDKFKGTLTAEAAANAIARGWGRARSGDVLELAPISDGGEGFGSVLAGLLGCEERSVRTVDAAHRKCVARWWWVGRSRTAIIESAEVIGLARLPGGRYHPFELDTFGLGAVLMAVRKAGARRCLVGIGGSATNDGGFGMAKALGWRFFDASGLELKKWTELTRLQKIVAPAVRPRFPGLVVAADVKNPLLGVRGATRIYGPQKGLTPSDFPLAERCLRRLVQSWPNHSGRDISRAAGAGAAGGLGFGLMAFSGARFEEGFGVFAKYSALREKLQSADLVITGEGAVDRSTMMGKGAGQMARLCKRSGKPCICLAGCVKGGLAERGFFTRTLALTDLVSAKAAKAQPARWLERLAAIAAGSWQDAE
jgi:glycerate kinase